MAIDRRRFLTGALAAAAWGATGAHAEQDEQEANRALYAATRKNAGGDYSAAIFDATGFDVNSVALPGRGHDVTICPVTGRCVAFARRPGNFAVAFSTDRSAPPLRFTTPADRHFYGHGVFSPDGRLLYATENDFEAGEGMIGIYDASGRFKRIAEFSAYGIGPHDLALLSDGTTLVIANGGIATHPDFDEGRMPLNPATMAPCLNYIDRRNGDLLETHALPKELHKVSLRHLDHGAKDRLVIGCQSEADYATGEPLILRHRRGEDLSIVSLPRETLTRLRGYISSVAIDGAGKVAALTSSKGGLIIFIDVLTGRVLGSKAITDVSGVASGPASGEFLLTSGDGQIIADASPQGSNCGTESPWHWDNHAVKL